ncbi:MAG: carboxypeptidase-like regulatory domain-containing protein [Gemmatimonadota bacterium]|nr:carboxypeptidase-like regulatory domain-containing protein [Gemmatimonadota bacterium]
MLTRFYDNLTVVRDLLSGVREPDPSGGVSRCNRDYSMLMHRLLARLVLPANTVCNRITNRPGRSSSIHGRQLLTQIPHSLPLPLKKLALVLCVALTLGVGALEAQGVKPRPRPAGPAPPPAPPPAKTPAKKPAKTPPKTPAKTPPKTPAKTPPQTPLQAPAQTPAQSPALPPGTASTFTLSGLVRAQATGAPLPYTTVSVEPLGRERFTDQSGWFRHFAVPAGNYRVRLRQLGYIPVDTTITVTSSYDFVFWLAKVPSTLADVHVTAPVRRCIVPEENGFVGDTDLTTVLGEARKNAERERLLRRTYPFEYKLAQAHDTYDLQTRTHRIIYDTLTFRSDDDWRYRKGRVVSEDQNKIFGAVRVMRLPTLTDLADVRFLTAHCFKYAGISDEDSIPTHRIDFEPTPDIKAPDVEGSIFIDSATYLIRRAEFRLTRGENIKPAILGMKVTTTYREILPNVALFNEIISVQPLSLAAPGKHRTEFRQNQRLLSYRFLYNGPPGSEAPMVWRKAADSPQTSDVSK